MSIASSEFQTAATTQANSLGLKSAPRVFVPHPIQDATDDEMRTKAEACLDEVVEALTS